MATRRISTTSARRRTHARRSLDEGGPMSLLQGPDEPTIEPPPGPQLAYGCSDCHHLPLGPNRLFLAMAAVMLVLSGAVLVSSMDIASLSSQVNAFNGQAVSAR
ncbi:hypothetical protein EPO34_01975 [Patescibacteria group bacterium]|nr:MAG: hypothetical protein EPO34_01975 [Patescibacteria group bacterium]